MSSSNDWSNARVKEEVKDDEEGSSQVFVKPEPTDEYETNVSVKREVEEIDPLSNPDRNRPVFVKPEPTDEYETNVSVKREVEEIDPLSNPDTNSQGLVKAEPVDEHEKIVSVKSEVGECEPSVNRDRDVVEVLVSQIVVKREVTDEAGSCSNAAKIEPAETTEDTSHFTLEQKAGIKKENFDSPGKELDVPTFEEDKMPASSERKAPSKKPIQKTTPLQDDEIDNKQLASPSICGKTSRKASEQALGKSGKAYHGMTRRSMATQSTRDEHEMTDEEPQMMTRSQKRKWLDDASKKKDEEEK